MRLFSRILRSLGNLIVVILSVITVESFHRARLCADSLGEPVATRITTFGEFPAESAGLEQPEFGGPIRERSNLTGDLSGRRSRTRDRGITLDVSTTQYYQGVAGGGLEQAFQYGGRNDYFLNIDGEKLGLWQGFSVALHGETRYGESVSSVAGTLMSPNLLLAFPAANGDVTALTGVTFTQNLSERLQLYGGKLNTLDDFAQPLTGADNFSGFQNTAMLYNPVFARTVPYSTFGAGVAYLDHNAEEAFSVTVYDTNDTTTVSGFDTFFNNGATVYTVWNLTTSFFDRPGHHGLSGTYSTGTYTDLTPTAYLDPIAGLVFVSTPVTGSWSAAYNFDQALYVSPDDSQRMWGVFGNFGLADNNPSPARWFASAGISGASFLRRRTADSFGFAYFYLGVSESLRNLAPLLLPVRDEHGIELYYNMALTPWCQITPDLQVITPFRDRADTALLLGLRAHVIF